MLPTAGMIFLDQQNYMEKRIPLGALDEAVLPDPTLLMAHFHLRNILRSHENNGVLRDNMDTLAHEIEKRGMHPL